ncbi:MAG: substrate-binding periplasmic protein [Fusobacteriaceae bacterium]
MKKIILLLLIFSTLFIGCVWENKFTQKNVYVVGIDDSDPPFLYRDKATEKLTGFEYDLILEIAKRGKLKLEIVDVNFYNLIPQLVTENLDLALGTFTITEERKELVNFSESYLESDIVVVGIKNNTKHQETKPIYSIPKGSIFINYIKNIKNITIIEELNYEKIIEKIHANEIDYIIMDKASAILHCNSDPLLYIKNTIQKTQVALAVSKKISSEDLTKINNIILKLKQDGTIEILKRKYGITG